MSGWWEAAELTTLAHVYLLCFLADMALLPLDILLGVLSGVLNLDVDWDAGADADLDVDAARMTLGTLKAITEGMKDTLGFDLIEVMRANTCGGKTSKGVATRVNGLPEAAAEPVAVIDEAKKEKSEPHTILA